MPTIDNPTIPSDPATVARLASLASALAVLHQEHPAIARAAAGDLYVLLDEGAAWFFRDYARKAGKHQAASPRVEDLALVRTGDKHRWIRRDEIPCGLMIDEVVFIGERAKKDLDFMQMLRDRMSSAQRMDLTPSPHVVTPKTPAMENDGGSIVVVKEVRRPMVEVYREGPDDRWKRWRVFTTDQRPADFEDDSVFRVMVEDLKLDGSHGVLSEATYLKVVEHAGRGQSGGWVTVDDPPARSRLPKGGAQFRLDDIPTDGEA